MVEIPNIWYIRFLIDNIDYNTNIRNTLIFIYIQNYLEVNYVR